jgi:UDP-N-acetylglucosamine--N-acetylmuramyl-(pentapeptide) pyrophosphoryl-undecaprenol N-acetylglucosamine transferase
MVNMKRKTVLIVSGGTGGHIFPALAVANALKQAGYAVIWLGSEIGMEADLVDDQFPFYTMPAFQLRGKGLLAKLKLPWRLSRAVFSALSVIHRQKPDLAIVFGGFVSPPGGLAAWLSRIPLFVQEQNARPGLANRLLSHLADAVFQAFPHTFPGSIHAETVGNPIRHALLNLPEPDRRHFLLDGKLNLLVIGGSLGAQSLNHAVVEWLSQSRIADRISVWHQCGKRNIEFVRAAYRDANLLGRVEPFINDMSEALQWADLVLCRAGASTVSELAAVGVPAIFVPLPSAVDNHQFYNAKYLTDQQAGFLLEQKDLSTASLEQLIAPLLDDSEKLMAMAKAAFSCRLPNAVIDIVAAVENLLG